MRLSPSFSFLATALLTVVCSGYGQLILGQAPEVPKPEALLPAAMDITGTWDGFTQFFGLDSRLEVEFRKDPRGQVIASIRRDGSNSLLDAKAVTMENQSFDMDEETPDGLVRYTGRMAFDGSQIRGNFSTRGYQGRFALIRKASAADSERYDFKKHYLKTEARIPMRDGVKLYTAIYTPKDAPGTHPILLARTPYSSAIFGPDAFLPPRNLDLYGKSGYILVIQDVRGRYQSEGVFQHVRPINSNGFDGKPDESTDAWDSIDWLLKHTPGNNGKVGLYGLSYAGFYAAAGMVKSHPALRAVSPQAPIMDWFVGDDLHRNGAFCLDAFEFLVSLFGPETNHPATMPPMNYDFGTPDGFRFYRDLGSLRNLLPLDSEKRSPFLAEALEHPNYDAFWKARNLRPHLRNIRPAVLTIGGWFDGEDLFGSLECFRSIEKQSHGTANHLVMGPWYHGQWVDDAGECLGQGEWEHATASYYREKIEKPFFDHHLMDAADPALPKAVAFDTGTKIWRRFDAWPPAQAKPVTFYVEANGKLSHQKPKSPSGFDEFVSDPSKPVPYKSDISTFHTNTYLIDDQRFVASRPDVMVYTSEPLSEDLTIAGPLEADLVVSTTGTDSDWVVKLIDEHPGDDPDPLPNPMRYKNGHWQELVRADVMRGKFRNGFERPEPFVPGKPTRVGWPLNDIMHTFRKGHRIMVQIQCSWFPLVDRNPQIFTNIHKAKPSDFRKATQRVYRSIHRPSRIVLSTLGPEKAEK